MFSDSDCRSSGCGTLGGRYGCLLRDLGSKVPESARPRVRCWCGPSSVGPPPRRVHAQHARVVAPLEARGSGVAEYPERCPRRSVGPCRLPRWLRRRIWSNVLRGRLNAREVRLVGEPDARRHLRRAQTRVQKGTGTGHPVLRQPGVRRHPPHLAEATYHPVTRHPHLGGQLAQRRWRDQLVREPGRHRTGSRDDTVRAIHTASHSCWSSGPGPLGDEVPAAQVWRR